MARTITGIVVSNKMTNTVVVEVERKLQHPVYKKYIKITKNIKADTNGHKIEEGKVVILQETKPISRDKYFKVIEVVSSNDEIKTKKEEKKK